MVRLKEIKHLDYLMLLATCLLLVVGWFSVYSAGYEEKLGGGIDYSQRQFVWMCFAIIIFFIMLIVDYHLVLKFSFLIYAVILGLLVLVLVLGQLRYGARRWLGIGGFSLQPSELAKIGIIFAVTKYLVLDIARRKTMRYIFISVIIIFIPLLLILKQPDLGTTLVFIPTLLVMLFAAGIGWKRLMVFITTGLLSLPSLWFLLRNYQKKRLLSFLNPDEDPLGSGYSIIQSKIALGSGGIFGKGWLGGTQNRLNFLPEHHTDFIFSIAGEEWGFIGAIGILMLFFIIVAAGFNIANKTPDTSGKILASGLVCMFGIQVAVNIGMTIGLVPVTGIPLPFISYGGTSLVVTMAKMGLLQNIYMRRFMF